MRRRVGKLESLKGASSGSGDPQGGTMSVHKKDSCVEFWEMEVECRPLHLHRGLEPRFTLDDSEAGDSFVTTDGRFVVSRDRMNLRELLNPRTEELPPRESRWERFLAADDEAADALERLFRMADAMADACVVPDEYSMSMLSHGYTSAEVSEFKGANERTAIFLDDEERERVRRLTWTLIHNPDARAMLSELTRRRDAFVREEGY
jgi:hypothetical protein